MPNYFSFDEPDTEEDEGISVEDLPVFPEEDDDEPAKIPDNLE